MSFFRRVVRKAKSLFAPSGRALIAKSGMFDHEWYLLEYPELGAVDPLQHYMQAGWKEGKKPSLKFDPAWYVSHYPDVARAGIEPLQHYLQYGRKEGRQPLPPRPILEVRKLHHVRLAEGIADMRCGVCVHLHYGDLAEEMLDACLNIPARSEIFVAATNDDAAAAANAWVKNSGFGSAVVRLCENRGRNVASFTTTFAKELRQCDVFCHIHSKKSLYSGEEQSGWRQSNLQHLLGSKEHVARYLSLFKDNENLGVIAPLPSPHMPYWAFTWLSNLKSGVELSKLLDVPFSFDGYFDYPLGCMFWARPSALAQLLDGRISLDKFPEEAGQTDGTLAHAVERSLYFVARSNGFDWIEVDGRDGTYKEGWSERNIFQYRSQTYSSLLQAIDSAKTVSFDIFDTLITRILPRPDDLFDMVEMSLGGGSNFSRHRKEVEASLRLANSSGDVGYGQIYSEMERRKETGAFARQAYECEESMEKRVTIPRKTMVDAVNYAISKGKRVVLASDMYLHRTQVEALLEQCGVRGYSKLYLSSETGLRKDDLSLWRHLMDEENAKDASFLHVGDNEHSDVQLPLALGIRYYHVLSPRNLFDFTPYGYRLRRGGAARRNPLVMGPTIATLCNDPFEGRS